MSTFSMRVFIGCLIASCAFLPVYTNGQQQGLLHALHPGLKNLTAWKNCHHIFTLMLVFNAALYSLYLFCKLSYVLGSAASEFFIEPKKVKEPEPTTPAPVEVVKPKPKPRYVQEQMPKKKRKKRPKRKHKHKK